MARSTSPIFRHAADLYHECRDEFEDHLNALLVKAEHATNGVMLNPRAGEAGIDSRSLLYGPVARLLAHGSEELIAFFHENARPTYAEFEAQWLAARGELAS